MGCSVSCMSGKIRKIYHGTDPEGSLVGRRVANDFKILIIILDYLPLKDLIRSSQSNK
jgi:hypothetical protein